MDIDLVRNLEERAFAAWPAEEVRSLGPWRLRYTQGTTRRANSVWMDGGSDLEPMVDEAERFYRTRGQPPLFQVSPLAPSGLDDLLAGRGYAADAPVAIEVAAVEAVAAAGDGRGRIERRLQDPWFEVAVRARFAAVAPVYRALLERIGDRALYALVEDDGHPAAVGLGVVHGEWMGVFNMVTAPDHRRRGLARSVLSALAAGARERGAARLYLQVERANAAARALYAGAGFAEVYGYHYRLGII